MEITLAIVVASAVIFFGALISMGNERQRNAIDNLRDHISLWIMQDLRIKRERLAIDVSVDDPLGWINKIATKVCGIELNLHVMETFEDPQILVCASKANMYKVVFSSVSLREIRKLKYERKSRLSRFTDQNLVLFSSHRITAYEISILNAGIMFDLELPLAWKSLTGYDLGQKDSIWMFFI